MYRLNSLFLTLSPFQFNDDLGLDFSLRMDFAKANPVNKIKRRMDKGRIMEEKKIVQHKFRKKSSIRQKVKAENRQIVEVKGEEQTELDIANEADYESNY